MRILIIYGQTGYPIRVAFRDNLYSFKKYLNETTVDYFNASTGKFPNSINPDRYDLIFFHHLFLSDRWTHGNINFFHNITLKNVDALKKVNVPKVLFTQDEWFQSNAINFFINEFQISGVFTVSPESEWKKLFHQVDFLKIHFKQVLTGYLDDEVINYVNSKLNLNETRSIDIGYRATKAQPWFGKKGFLKTRIAEIFKDNAPKKGFMCDISNEAKDTITGNHWFDFLLNCKYTLGVESGTCLHDPDGQIWKCGSEFLMRNPQATFEEIENHCFKGKDGSIHFMAISPRHLEACLTKTCQVLTEGEYNGILKPNIHYIELKEDFSNLNEVLLLLKDEKLRKEITENAYQKIVESNEFTYQKYTQNVLNTCKDWFNINAANATSRNNSLKLYFLELRSKQLTKYYAVGKIGLYILPEIVAKKIYKFIISKFSQTKLV
ncbi:MAG: hypothetical protein IPM51_02730 [Sphingobacteriaceae bacterium]|nr:hypothetical protein [Sphingobacteriaceae bacterium]